MVDPDDLGDYLLLPDVVHAASGMVSVQMHVTVAEAIHYLCEKSRRSHIDVVELAEMVVSREVRFQPNGDVMMR